MKRREYYSKRVGSRAGTRHNLVAVKMLFKVIYEKLERAGFFQEALGYDCVDESDRVPGVLGQDVASEVFRLTGNPSLWPPDVPFFEHPERSSEEDLFDLIEFLFDHVSEPNETTGYYHAYADCGWHYRDFDKTAGQKGFRDEVNALLEEYGPGYRLSEQGEIEELGELGLDTLLDAPVPKHDPENIEERIAGAVRRFRKYHTSLEDRKQAIRELVDVLEFIRPRVKDVLNSKDESDLFNLANNFGIRHHNPEQKTEYDRDVWYRWMFYYYLITIHAALRIIGKAENEKREEVSRT